LDIIIYVLAIIKFFDKITN